MDKNIFLAWVISLVATLGSLFFSEVMSFIPCTLCWYQRICMYPLTLILGIGLLSKDVHVKLYALPIAVVGSLFALYHNLIHYEIIPESASPCVMGVPCSTKYIEWFGFVTIPFLSFFAFILIIILFLGVKNEKR